jgi:hypothetical protein
MGSTVRSLTNQVEAESSPLATIRWRNWPLADHWRSSWTIPASILLIGAAVTSLGGGWLLGLAAVAALALALWQFLVPVTYEICSLGLRRYALGRMRLVPWSAIHSYQLRTTGVVFYQRPDPIAVDLLNSMFVPYPSDEDEVVVALRLYLPHAIELL